MVQETQVGVVAYVPDIVHITPKHFSTVKYLILVVLKEKSSLYLLKSLMKILGVTK